MFRRIPIFIGQYYFVCSLFASFYGLLNKHLQFPHCLLEKYILNLTIFFKFNWITSAEYFQVLLAFMYESFFPAFSSKTIWPYPIGMASPAHIRYFGIFLFCLWKIKTFKQKTCTSNQFIIRKKGKNIPRLKEYKSKSEQLSVETYSPLTENDAVKIGYKAFNGVWSGSLHVASTFVDHMSIQKRADFLQAFWLAKILNTNKWQWV